MVLLGVILFLQRWRYSAIDYRGEHSATALETLIVCVVQSVPIKLGYDLYEVEKGERGRGIEQGKIPQ